MLFGQERVGVVAGGASVAVIYLDGAVGVVCRLKIFHHTLAALFEAVGLERLVAKSNPRHCVFGVLHREGDGLADVVDGGHKIKGVPAEKQRRLPDARHLLDALAIVAEQRPVLGGESLLVYDNRQKLRHFVECFWELSLAYFVDDVLLVDMYGNGVGVVAVIFG